MQVDPAHVDTVTADDIYRLYPAPYYAVGGLYVFEGSTLGGTVLFKHLQKAIGGLEDKASYFRVYGEHTGSKWRHFLQQLSIVAEQPRAEDEIIEGAVQTFKALKDWMKWES